MPTDQTTISIRNSIRECIIPNKEIEGSRLSDIFGLDEVKTMAVHPILFALGRPDLPLKPPKSFLLYGPPGTGKTEMAKATVNEMVQVLESQVEGTSLTYFKVKSSNMLGSYYSQSERTVTALFAEIKRRAEKGAVVVFMDEVDALAMKRGMGQETQTERRVVTLFRDEWNDIRNSDKLIFIIGATNNKEDLDDAILDRFELKYKVPLPNEAARELIIKRGMQKRMEDGSEHMISDEQFKILARRTAGLSGRNLDDLCNCIIRRPETELLRKLVIPKDGEDRFVFAGAARQDLIVAFRHANEEVTRFLEAAKDKVDRSSEGQTNDLSSRQLLQVNRHLDETVKAFRSELAEIKSLKQKAEDVIADLMKEKDRVVAGNNQDDLRAELMSAKSEIDELRAQVAELLQNEHGRASVARAASATKRTSTRAAAESARARMSSSSSFQESSEESGNEDDCEEESSGSVSALDESDEPVEDPRQRRRPKRKAGASVARRESAAPRKVRSASKGRRKQNEKKWLAKYEELRQYQEEHGNCRVPRKYEPNPQLGRWVDTQRCNCKLLTTGKPANGMNPDKMEQLEEIGFEWSVRCQVRWEDRFKELCQYKKEHGHCLGLQKYEPNPPLGEWVKKQRYHYKLFVEGKRRARGMTEDRIRKLNDISFTWVAAR